MSGIRALTSVSYRILSALLLSAAIVSGAAAGSLPRANYFFVHDKGFTQSGRPNRDNSRLWVMQFVVQNGQAVNVRAIKSYRTQYGLRDEPKRREGDRSTPEGVYYVSLLKRHRPDHLTGPWNFLIDYPNRWDRRLNRTGGAIGIHGGPNRRTLGCIRLRDRETGGSGTVAIRDLHRYVEVGTPVISMPYLPSSLCGNPNRTSAQLLGREAARFYAHLLTTSLSNEHAVSLVRSYTSSSTDYLAQSDQAPEQRDLVTVSSELNPFGENTYRGSNLLDRNPTTCWSEGSEGDGSGEWVQLRFPVPRAVRRIKLINGYAKGTRWEQNSRVKRLSVRLSNGSSYDWPLRDTQEWQELVLPSSVTTRYVLLTIEEVYPGSRRDWQDASLSELAVDNVAPAGAASAQVGMTASASSVFEEGTASSGYYAHNVLDGDPRTCWSEAVDGTGIGEWLRVDFSRPRTLSQVRIINGYDKRSGRLDRWAQNARVKRATVQFSDGTTQTWALSDTREWQALELSRPVRTNYVRLTIQDAYRGSEWQDASISEIAFVDAAGGSASSAQTTQPTVTASSTLDEETSDGYLPGNVLDGDPTTCWSEAVDNAAGQWLRFEFPQATRLTGMHLVNGYAKTVGNSDRWEQNARVGDAVIQFSNGQQMSWALQDTRQWQQIDFPAGTVVNWVKLIIRSTRPGSRWQDTSVSEVRFDTDDSDDSSTSTQQTSSTSTAGSTSAGSTEGLVASATSFLADPEPQRYAAVNVLDGDPQTCWSEGVDGDGENERLRIELPSARSINRIRLINGYAKGDLWRKNNRINTLTVSLSDGSRYTWNLQDTDQWQEFTLPQPRTVFFVELVISSVTRGDVRGWRDTSISEVRVE